MVKKKSKFRHISISNKKYYFYEITWIDPCGDSGHATEKEFKAMKPATMTTNAYVFEKDKKYLWTFASYDEETFSDRNCFPIGCIKEMKKVEILKEIVKDVEIL